jgi:hypothetical protein
VEASPTFQRTLRPLGVGEILDRAVTLCVRNFRLLALTWGTFAAVVAVLEYFGTQDQSRMYAALADVFKHPAQGGGPDWNALVLASQNNAVFNGWTFAYFVAILLLTPLPSAALIAAVSPLYLGAPTSFGTAYRIGLMRFPQLILYNILWLLCAGIVYLAFIFAAIIFVFALVTIAQGLHVFGALFGVVIGTIAGFAAIAFALLATLAYEVGICTCVIDRRSFAESFTWALTHVFTRAGLGRSLLVGLASVAISIGYIVVSAMGQALLFGFVHNQALGLAYTAAVDIAGVIFATAFMTIFYYDVRVRTEGFDLTLAAGTA